MGADAFVRETLHIMDDEQRVALVETRVPGSNGSPAQLLRYQFGNHLGSASLELDDAGQIISYEEYYPYGSTSYQATSNQTETPKRYRYTGKERDEESALYYYGARYYSAHVGRWLRTDPAGFIDSDNLYAFTRQNPVRFVDIEGTDSKERAIKAYSKEKQIRTELTQELNRVNQQIAVSEKRIEKALEATDRLEHLSEKAIPKEAKRLKDIVTIEQKKLGSAKKLLPRIEKKLAKSTEKLTLLTDELRRHRINVGQMERELADMKRKGRAVKGSDPVGSPRIYAEFEPS